MSTEPQLFRKEATLMGNRFELTAVCTDEILGLNGIAAGIREIERIEALLSTFRADSETNRINDHAGIAPVQVSQEVFELVERCIEIGRAHV